MLSNYFMAALRNLARNRLYSAISIFGLAVGLCAATLTGLVIRNELSYDRFIPGYERLYLAAAVAIPTGRAALYNPESPSFVADALRLNFREIEAITRLAAQDVRLRHGEIENREKVYWADPNAFDLLRLPASAGDLHAALSRPDGIVLTRAAARKYFGQDNPLGETLQIDDQHVMTVTAVIDDLPAFGTNLETGVFASGRASYSSLAQCDEALVQQRKNGSVSLCGRTYVRLAPGAVPERLQPDIDAYIQRTYPRLPGMKFSLKLLRIDQEHLFSGFSPGIRARLTVTGAVGLLILIASCMVFVNLTTARSARRAREVGVRKACGASRASLILQFLGESLIYVVLAAVIASSMTELLLPSVNAFLNSAGRLDLLAEPMLAVWLVLGALLVGILAGAYPAFVLSVIRPVATLNGAVLQSGGSAVRQALVILQVALLIGLVISAAVVYQQRVYATTEALRVSTDQVLLIQSPCSASLVNELRSLGGVRGAYCSDHSLLDRMRFCNCRLRDGTPMAIDTTMLQSGTFALYGIRALAGRLSDLDSAGEFSPQPVPRVAINEAALHLFGFRSPAEAIGRALPIGDGPRQLAGLTHALDSSSAGEIVAIVPDFAIEAVEQRIRPTLYAAGAYSYELISVKLTGHDIPETLAAIDRLWANTGSKEPIQRFFLDEYLQNLYLVVLREAQVFATLALIAVVLSALGLLGLSAATAERRIREIGVRKAMGAYTADILRMLLWQFAKPVIWASVVAWPLSAAVMRHWLDGFAYHVDLSVWLFPAATLLALLICLVTVSAHAIAVARAKPVAALRYE